MRPRREYSGTARRALWFLAAWMPCAGAFAQIPLFVVVFPLDDGETIRMPWAEIAISLAGLALGLVSLAAFVAHAATNPRLDQERRRRWVIGFVLANAIAQPMYWRRYQPGHRR